MFSNAAKNTSRLGWFLTLLVLSCVVGAGVAGYIFYKYRLRVRCCAVFVVLIFFEEKNSLHLIHDKFEKDQKRKLIFSFYSHTWIPRSWQLCLSTCHSTTITTMPNLFDKIQKHKQVHIFVSAQCIPSCRGHFHKNLFF